MPCVVIAPELGERGIPGQAVSSRRKQIPVLDGAGAEVRQAVQLLIERGKIVPEDQLQHVLETLDDEIAELERVGPVVRAEHTPEVEIEPVRARSFSFSSSKLGTPGRERWRTSSP